MAALEATNDLSVVADAVCAAYLSQAGGSVSHETQHSPGLSSSVANLDATCDAIAEEAKRRFEADNPNPPVPHRPMHWPLAFPEVFIDGGGFDIVVANPRSSSRKDSETRSGAAIALLFFTYLARRRKGKAFDFIAYLSCA